MEGNKADMDKELSSTVELLINLREIEKKDPAALPYIKGFIEGVKIKPIEKELLKSD